ncbi:MAG UNVERIFIED_CONTAM: hypothetical protein LVR18_42355, partial [Planctomycetaceae bacterium]
FLRMLFVQLRIALTQRLMIQPAFIRSQSPAIHHVVENLRPPGIGDNTFRDSAKINGLVPHSLTNQPFSNTGRSRRGVTGHAVEVSG